MEIFRTEEDKIKYMKMLMTSLDMYNTTLKQTLVKNDYNFTTLIPIFAARGDIESKLLDCIESEQLKKTSENKTTKKDNKTSKDIKLGIKKVSSVTAQKCTDECDIKDLGVMGETIINKAVRLNYNGEQNNR